MKQLFSILFLILTSFSFGQYWQQEVNYKIEVKLNDKEHSISAFEEFEYINHSPNTLDFIYIHLWPNAYKNGKTALAKQLYRNNEKDLTFGNDSIRGWIDSIDFKIDGKKAEWIIDEKNIDICKLMLSAPLKPGERITISTPFKVKIPSGEISRLGHVGQSYQITQWYPKPAVYDKNGWNQMPYLNQGEFYSEYGSFDVSITLPKNYVVGATGDLQTDSEIAFLNDLDKQTKEYFENLKTSSKKGESKNTFPKSSDEWKTIRYIQKNVHDFAWFADKRFRVLKSEVELPHSKRKVTTWAMFTPKNEMTWKKAPEYINDGTYYYSLWNGDYPYNQVTAIDGTISAGGGMEYPNVTVIGNTPNPKDLEIVIVHEVGHNWFYGILGSNERVHGWMDEGLNTLNEVRYVQTKYPNNTYLSDQVLGGRFHFNDLDHHDSGDLSYRMIAAVGEDQPLETHSADFTSINYGIIMYQKTGLIFHYLKDYMGEKKFDEMMQTYFDSWKFKHPQPEDIRAVLEKVSGKDLSWFFEDLIQTTNHIDYKIQKVKKSEKGTDVSLKNVGQVAGPMPVTAYGSGKVETKWIESGVKKSTVNFAFAADSVKIDPSNNIPEIYRHNNMWRKDGLFHKKEKTDVEFFIGDIESSRKKLFWLPILGSNAQDKFMLGAAFHNIGVPFRKNQFLIAPMFSFGRKNVSGIAELMHTFLPKNNVKLIRTGVSVKSFGSGSSDYFAAVLPYVYMKLGNRGKSNPFSESFLLQGMYRYNELGFMKVEQAGAFAKYGLDLDYPDNKISFNIRTDYLNNINNRNEMLRITAEAVFKHNYTPKKKKAHNIELRLFSGSYLINKLSTVYFNGVSSFTGYEFGAHHFNFSGTTGAGDAFLEDYYFSGHDATSGIQHGENQGNFKVGESLYTNASLSTANLYVPLPLETNIFGVFADAGLNNGNFYADAGLGIRLGSIVGIYFPLWMSENFQTDVFSNYGSKIRISIKMNPLNMPLKLKGLF